MRGKFIVQPSKSLTSLKYKKINEIDDIKCSCIVVKTLNPDYYLLFSKLKLIITETGSPLSHLAILAREHNIPIFLAETKNIPDEGTLSILNDEIQIN